MATKQKITVYFPEDLLAEARKEAERQDRTISWILQKAWILAKNDIRLFPSGCNTWMDVPEPIVNEVFTRK